MLQRITSTKNESYKLIKSLQRKKNRVKLGLYTVEGIKSVRDAIEAKAELVMLAISEELENEITAACDILVMPSGIFAGLCDTETPQGVLAVIKIPDRTAPKADRLLFCDRVSDPGNLGTIIRCCDAAGFSLMLSENTADLYSPKTVRSSMGSFFHFEVSVGVTTEQLVEMKKSGYKIISGALADRCIDYSEADYSGKVIIVVGNEANGVSDEVLGMSDSLVKIPIEGRAESLNVGIAAALLMYEARRK